MSNDISVILQPFAPQHRAPGQARSAVQSASQPAVIEKPAAPRGDRVTLTDSASRLQLAESKPGRLPAPPSESADVGMTYTRTDSGVRSASSHLSVDGNAQRLTPAMANMIEAFFTTSEMEGFDPNSDLNDDGAINFLDLAALRDIETGVGAETFDNPKAFLSNMIESFFSSEGSKEFDAAADLNVDGMINFQDLAIFRAKLENSLNVDGKALTSSD